MKILGWNNGNYIVELKANEMKVLTDDVDYREIIAGKEFNLEETLVIFDNIQSLGPMIKNITLSSERLVKELEALSKTSETSTEETTRNIDVNKPIHSICITGNLALLSTNQDSLTDLLQLRIPTADKSTIDAFFITLRAIGIERLTECHLTCQTDDADAINKLSRELDDLDIVNIVHHP